VTETQDTRENEGARAIQQRASKGRPHAQATENPQNHPKKYLDAQIPSPGQRRRGARAGRAARGRRRSSGRRGEVYGGYLVCTLWAGGKEKASGDEERVCGWRCGEKPNAPRAPEGGLNEICPGLLLLYAPAHGAALRTNSTNARSTSHSPPANAPRSPAHSHSAPSFVARRRRRSFAAVHQCRRLLCVVSRALPLAVVALLLAAVARLRVADSALAVAEARRLEVEAFAVALRAAAAVVPSPASRAWRPRPSRPS